MQDSRKTKAQLVAELEQMRSQVAELEAFRAKHLATDPMLVEERNLLRTLIDHLPDYIFFKDAESRFITNNQAHRQVLGAATLADVVGKTDFDFFPPELAEQYYADEQAVLASGAPLLNREEATVDPAGRRQWLLTSKVPLRDSQGRIVGLVGISRDITDRKRAEEALERSNADLEQFAYMVSNEMQEPLQAIARHLEYLASRLDEQLDAEGREVIGRAQAAAQRVQGLSNQLLDYSRMGTWGTLFEQVDSREVLEHTLEHLQPDIQATGAAVTYDPLPTVTADPSQLLRLFQDLIHNALVHRGEAPPRVHVAAARQENGWRFSVRDNGIGIEPQHAERIFAIFQRLHQGTDHAGAGIGLALCKRIVEHHGGRIWVESAPGQGATFHFTLPDALPVAN